MKNTAIRLLSVLLVLCMMLAITACGNNEDSSSAAPADDASTTTTTSSTQAAPTKFINPLTGEADMDTENARPLAIVVTDESATLVQLGAEGADMYFEAETESGIPRMLCIFSSADRMPEYVGPVRSARPHFVKMVAALDAIYCHVGGSPAGVQTIKDLGVTDIEDASIKHQTLINSDNYSWNVTAFTREKVLKTIESRKLATTTDTKSPFVFGKKDGDKPATTVDIKISASYNMGFTYDAERGVYQKHRNSLKTPVHTTATGGTIEVSNIIVMYDKRTVLDYKNGSPYRCDFDMNSGVGQLVTNGTVRDITWKRTNDQLSYFEADGTTPLTVSVGKTYIAVVNKELKSQTTFK